MTTDKVTKILLVLIAFGLFLNALTFWLRPMPTAAAAGKLRTIEVEKIIVFDTHGRARITIGTPAVSGVAIDMKPDEPAIWLTDEKGQDRAILTSDGLRLAKSHGKPAAF